MAKYDKDLSRLVNSTLDTFGFHRDCVSFRSKMRDKMSLVTENKCNIPIKHFLVGSRGEGVGLADSDIDIMYFMSFCVCVDDGSDYERRGFNIFEAESTMSAPGYTKLVPKYIDKQWDKFIPFSAFNLHISPSGIRFLSSEVLNKYFYRIHESLDIERDEGILIEVSRNGPATTTHTEGTKEQDHVFCVLFYVDKYLKEWANRARVNTWPSHVLADDVSNMEGYIVPIGDKFSETHDIEWRICYTTAEKKLIESFDDVQTKLYVLLKLIAKKVLKRVCKEISSYVVKNVVFWVLETQPIAKHQLSPDQLLSLVRASLHFLRQCLQDNHLPNYIMPKRNLLSAVRGEEKRRTIRFLSECLEIGGNIVFKIPALRTCIYFTYFSPEREKYIKVRNEVEKLMFEIMLLECEALDIHGICRTNLTLDMYRELYKNIRYLQLCQKVRTLIVPEIYDFVLAGRWNEVLELVYLRAKALHML